MDLYLFTLGLSFGALLLMALLGLSHHHAPGKTAHTHGPAFKLHKAVRFHSGAPPHHTPRPGAFILAMLSPRTLFSILLGFGATGLLLRPVFHGSAWLVLVLAIIGGWAFESLVMNPFWTFLFGFASTPARTLDTLTLEEGHAVTDFDAAGDGLIAVNLDGQVRQVLGKLVPEDRAPDAPRVRTGDRLFIRAVDRRRNTCTVSRVIC